MKLKIRRPSGKVLVTGATRRQCGVLPSDYSTCSDHLIEMLSCIGCDVERRPVMPGEDLSHYRKVIAFLAPVLSMTAKYGLGATWAQASRSDSIVCLNDWNVGLITANAKQVTQGALSKRGWPVGAYVDMCGTEEYMKPDVQGVCKPFLQSLGNKVIDRNILWPATFHNDWSKVGIEAKRAVVAYDPSYWSNAMYDSVFDYKKKSNVWSVARLTKGGKLKHFDGRHTWPAEYFGKKDGNRVPEKNLIEAYLHSWGIVSPAYPHKGSGWWRPRANFAAMCGSILLCDKEEGEMFGPAYQLDIEEIESMSIPRLRNLADNQRADAAEFMTPRNIILNNLQKVLDL